jgi:hypothetical protein
MRAPRAAAARQRPFVAGLQASARIGAIHRQIAASRAVDHAARADLHRKTNGVRRPQILPAADLNE